MAQTLKEHNYRFEYQVSAGRWRWVTVFDISGPVAVIRVESIQSPYGILRDSIPIPGEVVASMAESIDTVQQQFPPSILLGPPTVLTFTVDEGRGYSDPIQTILTNNGSYGSLLSANLVSSDPCVKVSPANMGSLGFNATGLFEVSVDSATLLSGSSPYAATVSIQDNYAPNSPQVLPITIVVRPKAEVSVTPSVLAYTVTKPLSGDWPVLPVQTFQVSNSGPAGSVLDWQVTRMGSSTWITSITPSTGSLASGAHATVSVTVVPDSRVMAGTTYTEILRINGYSSNEYADVEIRLQVT